MSNPKPVEDISAKVVRIDRAKFNEPNPDSAVESEGRSVFDPPKMPRWLKGEARKHWKIVVDNLMNHGVINELDADMIAVYCMTWARWVEAERLFSEEAMFQKFDSGAVQYSPYFTAARDLAKDVVKFAKDLALTPPSRSKMRVVESPDSQGAFDDF